MNSILRKCKSLSISKLKRTSSYSSLRSKSIREEDQELEPWEDKDATTTTKTMITIFVGRSRRRYSVEKRHLDHPLLSTLIDRSSVDEVQVRCEVVLFDHLLWMLDNSAADAAGEALEELAELYAC